MNEIHLRADWQERSWKEQKDKNNKANKTNMPSTRAIKTKRSAFSLVTRAHRWKIDMTNVVLIEMWVSSFRGRFREKAGKLSSWLKGKEMILWKHGFRKAGRYSVSTRCGDKKGMKHHLRDRNNWSIAAQTQWDHQPPVSTRTTPGKWAITPESGRERKRLLGPVLLTELWL